MQNLLRIDYENILLKTSANLWGDYPIIKHRYVVSRGHMPHDVAHRRMAYPFVYNHVKSL